MSNYNIDLSDVAKVREGFELAIANATEQINKGQAEIQKIQGLLDNLNEVFPVTTDTPKPIVNCYSLSVSVLETNTYDLVVYATSEEQARVLAQANGISSGERKVVDGVEVGLTENCYEFDSWGMGGEPVGALANEIWRIDLNGVTENVPMPALPPRKGFSTGATSLS